MSPEEQNNKIIGNESNSEYEIETGSTRKMGEPVTETNKPAQDRVGLPTDETTPINNDLATNDGSIVETLDTAFHNKPGVAESENPSGSDRADYYESKEQGKTDSEEEFEGSGRNQNS